MKRLQALIVAMCFVGGAAAQNQIVTGPGYKPNQMPAAPIRFDTPKGWRADAQAAEKAGLFAVLLPDGKTLEATSLVITIAFQKKDAQKPGLATLDGFFRTDIENVFAQFPKLEAARWQPRGLNPDKVNFRSLEMFGDKMSPHRFVIIEAPDGFFSITLTAESRADLAKAEFEAFFNSLKLD